MRQQMSVFLFAALMVVQAALMVVQTASASAETSADAMMAFGLLGTWAANCAANPTQFAGKRLRFSSDGTPKLEVSGYETYNIVEATRVTEEKIKILLKIADNQAEFVFVKDGKKIIETTGAISPEVRTSTFCPAGSRSCPAAADQVEIGLNILERCLN